MQPNIVKAFTVTFIVYFIYSMPQVESFIFSFSFTFHIYIFDDIFPMILWYWFLLQPLLHFILNFFFFHFSVRFNRCNCWFQSFFSYPVFVPVRKQLHILFLFLFLFSNLEKYVSICWIDWNSLYSLLHTTTPQSLQLSPCIT